MLIVHYKFTAFIAIIQIIRNLYFIELTLIYRENEDKMFGYFDDVGRLLLWGRG